MVQRLDGTRARALCADRESRRLKKIEDARIRPDPTLSTRVHDFWTRNVNAERLRGQAVSRHRRGDPCYFADLETQRYRSHRHLMPWIRAMQPGRTVLEVGCGVGLDSYAMVRLGLNLTAIDLTEVGVTTAARRFRRESLPGRFLVADAEQLPFAAASFDYVYSFGVLHHAADTAACIREVHRILRPGGEARLMLYHRHSLNELVHRLSGVPFEEKDELCPVVRRYTRSEALALCRKFARVEIGVDYLFGEGYGPLLRLTPWWLYRALSRVIGWHLMILAVK
jgi:ubiquinone/menaquinone biosynthesis C-methylase UbiE